VTNPGMVCGRKIGCNFAVSGTYLYIRISPDMEIRLFSATRKAYFSVMTGTDSYAVD